jgi:hypothetical protein
MPQQTVALGDRPPTSFLPRGSERDKQRPKPWKTFPKPSETFAEATISLRKQRLSPLDFGFFAFSGQKP